MSKYRFQGRVRYSEIDEEGKITLPGIINYFQDCSTFQSEDCGAGLSYLKENNRAWVLNSWQIVLCKYPKISENIIIST